MPQQIEPTITKRQLPLQSHAWKFLRSLDTQITCSVTKEKCFNEQSKSSRLYLMDPCIWLPLPSQLIENRGFDTLIHRLRHFLDRIEGASKRLFLWPPWWSCTSSPSRMQELWEITQSITSKFATFKQEAFHSEITTMFMTNWRFPNKRTCRLQEVSWRI